MKILINTLEIITIFTLNSFEIIISFVDTILHIFTLSVKCSVYFTEFKKMDNSKTLLDKVRSCIHGNYDAKQSHLMFNLYHYN